MTWFGTVSAWAALAMGSLYGVLTALQISWGLLPWQIAIIAAALLVGGFRTLRKMPGGLRLLAGGWGLAAGMAFAPPFAPQADLDNPNLYGVDVATGWVVLAMMALPFVGLVLAVLNKERN